MQVAFIGLGNMGVGMASRLLDAGHQISVYNRTAAKAASIVSRGGRLATSPKDACLEAGAVFSMVSDDAASREMWLGAEGILASDLAPGALAIECSTLSHDWVIELASQVTARGLLYIDAPVTGLPAAAASGSLTLLVGAREEDLGRARGLLNAVSNRIIHFGTVGTGTAYKLIVNMLGAVQIASAAECMALAQRAGLDLGVVADAIAVGQAASPQVVRNVRRIVAADHDRDIVFTAALRLKDLRYALQLARELGVGVPFGGLAEAGLVEMCDAGRSQVNESGIFEVAAARRVQEPV